MRRFGPTGAGVLSQGTVPSEGLFRQIGSIGPVDHCAVLLKSNRVLGARRRNYVYSQCKQA